MFRNGKRRHGKRRRGNCSGLEKGRNRRRGKEWKANASYHATNIGITTEVVAKLGTCCISRKKLHGVSTRPILSPSPAPGVPCSAHLTRSEVSIAILLLYNTSHTTRIYVLSRG